MNYGQGIDICKLISKYKFVIARSVREDQRVVFTRLQMALAVHKIGLMRFDTDDRRYGAVYIVYPSDVDMRIRHVQLTHHADGILQGSSEPNKFFVHKDRFEFFPEGDETNAIEIC